jgi:hypothetical protein
MLKTRSDIQKEKPNKTQRTIKKSKTTPRKKKKKNHQLLSRHESNQACSTNPIPSSTNKNKRGEKENAVHEMKKNKNKKEETEKLERSKKRELLECETLSAASKLFANYCTNQQQIFLCYCLIL